MLHSIIIEDEPAAQSVLLHNISLCPGLECDGVFADSFAAQAYLDQHHADLIFLDINLPGMSGVSFLRSLVHPPMVIFTTAYPEYALEGFDLEIIDFLLKPFSFERFNKAVNKAKDKIATKNVATSPPRINVKCDKRIYQISIEDILFVEACGDYVSLVLSDKKLVVHGTLKSWEERLEGFKFQKIHRTAIVNVHKISHVDVGNVCIGAHKIPMSESFKSELLAKMVK